MSQYNITDKFCVITDGGAFNMEYDTREEAIDDAVKYCIAAINNMNTSLNCGFEITTNTGYYSPSEDNPSEDEIRKELETNGYIDHPVYCSIYNTLAWEKELAVDCYLYIKMKPGENKEKAFDRLIKLLPPEVEINVDMNKIEEREI